MAVFLEEFLYRGRDPVEEPGKPSTYHVVLGNFIDAPGGGKSLVRSRALTPAQATANGFPLATITGAIVAAALLDKDAADASRDAMQIQRDTAQTERAAAQAERDAALNARDLSDTAKAQALADLAACQTQGQLVSEQLAQTQTELQVARDAALNAMGVSSSLSAGKRSAKSKAKV